MNISLSPKQKEALELVALGYTNNQIGTTLGVSPSRAKELVGFVCKKLGAATRAEAVAQAYRQGVLVSPGVNHAG